MVIFGEVKGERKLLQSKEVRNSSDRLPDFEQISRSFLNAFLYGLYQRYFVYINRFLVDVNLFYELTSISVTSLKKVTRTVVTRQQKMFSILHGLSM